MRHVLRTSALVATAGGALAGAAVLLGVDRRDHVLDAYLVLLAAVAAATVARIAARALPSPRRLVPAAMATRPERRDVPASLAHVENMVALAQADELDVHYRLRPLLTEIASAGYAMTRGGAREGLPAAAEQTFSAATWELVRPGRPRPAGPGERGISSARLGATLDELESILPP